jgi:hypothetical protein
MRKINTYSCLLDSLSNAQDRVILQQFLLLVSADARAAGGGDMGVNIN